VLTHGLLHPRSSTTRGLGRSRPRTRCPTSTRWCGRRCSRQPAGACPRLGPDPLPSSARCCSAAVRVAPEAGCFVAGVHPTTTRCPSRPGRDRSWPPDPGALMTPSTAPAPRPAHLDQKPSAHTRRRQLALKQQKAPIASSRPPWLVILLNAGASQAALGSGFRAANTSCRVRACSGTATRMLAARRRGALLRRLGRPLFLMGPRRGRPRRGRLLLRGTQANTERMAAAFAGLRPGGCARTRPFSCTNAADLPADLAAGPLRPAAAAPVAGRVCGRMVSSALSARSWPARAVTVAAPARSE